jgi:hypothetical protein
MTLAVLFIHFLDVRADQGIHDTCSDLDLAILEANHDNIRPMTNPPMSRFLDAINHRRAGLQRSTAY